MFRRLGGVTALVAGLAFTPLTSGSAHATPSDSESGSLRTAATCAYTPSTLVLGADPRSVKFVVPDAADWRVRIPDLAVDSRPGFQVKHFEPKDYKNADAGLHPVTISRDGVSCAAKFRLLRPSMLTLVVVHNHPYRYIGGQLVRTNYGTGAARSPMPGARVAIQYLTKDGWVTAKYFTTNKKGIFIGKLKAPKRTWRAAIERTSTTAASVSHSAKTEREYSDTGQ
ncbi:hypothetical protein [Kineosporia sp. NBRC 101731]|uniref:hypothetical protein n=1 Tax=Kineosporia sp. NBRC 101731 TaxID=3032199 RepID=UPI0024A5CD38|nr:hypothetical protein [Kineosporia sp. NBRC 101731]GLY31354.1 hypothetical protein Kisp02_47190 [Kineosporia sp. NBRC 101731]